MKTKILFTLLTLIFINLNSFTQNAISFDGTNDQVDCGNDTSVQITGTAITLEAWIYPTSWKTNIWQGNIINKEALSGGGFMLRCGAGGKLNFNIGSGPGWNEISSSTNILTLNTWQHVAGTYDGSFLRIYLNGVLVDSLTKTITMANSTSALGVGFAPIYAGSRNFPGKIDEVRVWNVTRSKAEIAANMNNELCVIPSSVKAYYTFNQGIASGTNTTVTTLTDLSSNGNTGTLSNIALSGTTSNWVTGQTLTPGAVVSTNNISACGSYTMPDGRVITVAGTYYDTLPSSTPCDSLIGYNISFPPAIISNTINDVGCINYTTALGNLITTSGTYYDTISTGSGCDTTVEYNITISGPVDDSVYRVGGRMDSYDTWAAHQWVRCDSNYKPITGATNRFYIATQPGDYAVIVTRGSCVDTSDCFNIVMSNISEIENSNYFTVFPNPATNELNIDAELSFINNQLKIYSISGRLENNYLIKGKKINISNLSKGVYFIEINDGTKLYYSKFVKQ
ncbi:T9SS type A sorting domain-containing protein [Flavobacteriales bacterium]|nr:T9SS type A sorting domain-containing protein [Flavobacteriales bacterium]